MSDKIQPSKPVQLDPWPFDYEKMKHIFKGLQRAGVSPSLFIKEAKPWIMKRPLVPIGKWCKQFPSFRFAGNGNQPGTGLGPSESCQGEWVI